MDDPQGWERGRMVRMVADGRTLGSRTVLRLVMFYLGNMIPPTPKIAQGIPPDGFRLNFTFGRYEH